MVIPNRGSSEVTNIGGCGSAVGMVFVTDGVAVKSDGPVASAVLVGVPICPLEGLIVAAAVGVRVGTIGSGVIVAVLIAVGIIGVCA